MTTPVPEPHGIYPLTLFDDISTSSGIVMGWLVEGLVDLDLLSAALDRLLSKWPALAGRLEPAPGKNKLRYQIRFPVGAYPKEYKTYTLTSSVSTRPISDFFTLPLPAISVPPPDSLFLHKSTPYTSGAWASRQHPLTCWHVTHFPHNGAEYSCIGVAFSHGLFDGMGISFFVHALESEMLGQEWEVPTPLHEGLNVNMVQEHLDCALDESLGKGKPESGNALIAYDGITPATPMIVVRFLLWHLWQEWWHRAKCRTVILPQKACLMLVDRTRKEAEAEGLTDVRLSTGDILVAWFFKTIYSDGTPPSRTVQCSGMATFRPFFPEALRRYPHNCFLPIPYPIATVKDLQSTPLHVLARSFTTARKSLSLAHSVSFYNTCLNASKDKNIIATIPTNFDADETFTVTNVSIARIVNIDWTGIGGKTTICRYKSVLINSPMLMTNLVTIAGRTHDEGIVMDVVLAKKRLARLETEVQKLIRSSG